MELYEIIKTKIIERYENSYLGQPSVVTATMDKAMAEQMLAIYKHNCGENEEYEIRTVTAPQILHTYECCKSCNSFSKCVSVIREISDVMIRCIRFGELKQYIEKENKQ